MVPARALLLSLSILLGTALDARSQCPVQTLRVQLPSACVGASTAGSASFCFAPEAACLGTGVVIGIVPPGPPFSVTALHVDGPLGTRAVAESAFPVVLQPGESMVADVSAALVAPGSVLSRLGWIASTNLADLTHGAVCGVDLLAATPICAGPSAANPCVGEACVAGACVPAPLPGPCEDGDPCTVGDTCVNGVCQAGLPLDCSHTPCTSGAVCVGGACVGGTPVSCADTNPCTVDSCDPVAGCLHVPSDALCQSAGPCMLATCDAVRGCVQTPLTGPACDDGDPCTTGDRCAAGVCRGTAIQCSDPFDCTDDRCVAGVCQHVPIDARCGSEDCTAGACRPGAPGADGHGCVSVPVADGEACTDDGLACTDDVCTAGGCLHVPIDSRCDTGDQCQPAVCAPERSDADARGCAIGPPPPTAKGGGGKAGGGGGAGTGAPGGGGTTGTPPSGGGDGKDGGDHGKGKHSDLGAGPQRCAEDGDPCTDDLCSNGRCVHTPVADVTTCEPVNGAFRKALGLAALARTLMATMESARTQTARSGPGMTALGHVEQDLDAAVLALSGKSGGALTASVRPATFAETTAQQRARIAFTLVLRTPQQIRSFLTVVAQARTRAQLGPDTSRTLRRRGRLLLRGTKTLKGELRRLRQVTQTFAR